MFKDVFAKLPIGVLWKYEEEMADKPDNVYTSDWIPQRDILSMNKSSGVARRGAKGTSVPLPEKKSWLRH